ncbi:MAG: ABC transporter substrate-binding protein, partial [Bdellovibrionaceae bacterium]|nr:ABC transporter substrate-binding protein [Pseudobdellovibrionaceae bacterium]
QIPWATQGQLVQIWKRTDILKKNGLEAEFIGRTYGPMLNEVALAGGLDVVLTADQPAATLFSKDKGWVGIGRLMYNRTLTYVPPKSPVKSVKDLKGKTIGIPVGAAAERVTVAALTREGLDPKKDVKIVNLGIQEQGPLVQGGQGKTKWEQFDALSGFDPIPAIFESKGWVRVIDSGQVVSLVLMNEEFLKKNKDVGQKVMQAMVDAYDYYRQNIEQANTWFMEEAQLKEADQKTCNLAASVEPNLRAKAKSEIRVSLNEEDLKLLQSAADFLEPQLKRRLDMRKYVSNKYVSGLK